ncbi:MAG TPA: chemotaxis protein [Nitrospirae bacterium]|nr:chemotaxis protein [Nitrospirota bacterium]
MKDSKIIIKKVKKTSEGGGHGGSWKVAYADFVTAMMAFFLLLWLVTMVSPEKRARVATYFKEFSIFEKGGTSFMDKSSEMFNEPGETSDKAFADYYGTFGDKGITPEALQQAIKEAVESLLGDIKDQILVRVVKEGVKIEIIDKNGSSMFPSGSAELTTKAEEILKVLADNINNIKNKLFIEGHTDSYSYSSNSNYTNWELSADRANAARRDLERLGIAPARIVRVVGYADTDPLFTDSPLDPKNRRISIVILFPDKKKAGKK